MHKSTLRRVITTVMAMILIVTIAACKKEETSSGYVGKYNLTSLTGVSGMTAESYDYCYIKLEKDHTFFLDNSYEGSALSQNGNWSVKGNVFTMKTEENKNGEDFEIKEDRITIKNASLVMIFDKEK